MTHSQLRVKLTQYGIVSKEAQDEAIAEILGLIPEASKSQYPNEEEAALKFYDAWVASKGGKPVDTSNQQNNTNVQPGQTPPAATLSVSDQKALRGELKATREARIKVSAGSKIVKVLMDKPRPVDYLGQYNKDLLPLNPKLVESLEKYAPLAEPTDGHIDPSDQASVDAYNQLKTACMNSQKVPPHISDKYGTPIGVEVEVPSTGEGKAGTVKQRWNKRSLCAFLVNEAYGVIPTDKGSGLGAKLAMPKKRKNNSGQVSSDNASSDKASPIAKILGTSQVTEKADGVALEVLSKATDAMREVSVSTDLAFKVQTSKRKKVNQQDVPIMRTVRLRVRVPAPVFERIHSEDIAEFGTGQGDAQKASMPQSTAEKEKQDALLLDALSYAALNPDEAGTRSISAKVGTILQGAKHENPAEDNVV